MYQPGRTGARLSDQVATIASKMQRRWRPRGRAPIDRWAVRVLCASSGAETRNWGETK